MTRERSCPQNKGEIGFTVPGTPVAKGRARTSKNGGFYTPQKTADAEASVGWCAKQAMRGKPPLEGVMEVVVEFCFLRPKSARKRVWPSVKPDLDNLIKTLDGLNGIVWRDDAQVVKLTACKVYEPVAETRISVRALTLE